MEDVSCFDTNAIILKGTTVLTYKPRFVDRPFSGSLFGIEVRSLCVDQNTACLALEKSIWKRILPLKLPLEERITGTGGPSPLLLVFSSDLPGCSNVSSALPCQAVHVLGGFTSFSSTLPASRSSRRLFWRPRPCLAPVSSSSACLALGKFVKGRTWPSFPCVLFPTGSACPCEELGLCGHGNLFIKGVRI